MRILGLDTSGKTASVAILDTEQGILLGEHTVYTSRTHSQVILPMCKSLLEECRLSAKDIDCMAVAVGPGSYTGLRIGIAAVQGMAMANNTPCIGVSTLEAMASRIVGAVNILAVMHAREDLFYSAWFSSALLLHREPKMKRGLPDELQSAAQIAEMIDKLSVSLRDHIIVVGDGAEELIRQYEAMGHEGQNVLRLAPPTLRLQSAAGVCMQAAAYIETHNALPTASDLTASYLQAVQIQKKKNDKLQRGMDL